MKAIVIIFFLRPGDEPAPEEQRATRLPDSVEETETAPFWTWFIANPQPTARA